MEHSVLPCERLLSVDERLRHAAAVPPIIPETVVIDGGTVLVESAQQWWRAGNAPTWSPWSMPESASSVATSSFAPRATWLAVSARPQAGVSGR